VTGPATVDAGLSWSPPDGIAVRGTVVLLPGRGEHAGVYERYGRRLAIDGYQVRALDVTPDGGLDGIGRQVAGIAQTATAPVVLAGSDTGALQALAIAAAGVAGVDGLLLAGVPSAAPPSPIPRLIDGSAAWEDELEARTACPTHRARLTGDEAFTRGSLSTPVPAGLAATVAEVRPALPTLVLHGGDDRISPARTARSLAGRLPHAELAIVRGGRHDVLNDATHRTVAAHVVQWLERLRNGPDTAAILTVEVPVPPDLPVPPDPGVRV
jgi:alpha-beta hydrolase superfamily lysophospholipase